MAFENLQDRQFVPEELIEQLKNYDTMKSHLLMDLVGKEANSDKLQFVAHTDMEDIALIKRPAINDKLDFDTAKVLISEYKKIQGKV